MTLKGGYVGRILNVDLTSGNITGEKLDENLVKKVIGGRGLGAKMLFDRLLPGTDALSPNNLLIFVTGPLTGTTAPGSLVTVVAKSPLTNGYADSKMGGSFGPELKFAGYDALIIKGRSEKHVFLRIDDDEVKILDAPRLWGLGTFAASNKIAEEIGDETAKIACIGPAGENVVKIACISSDDGRQAGRCGMGAVMGSKNLKAIAIRGTGDIKVANPKAFQQVSEAANKLVLESADLDSWRLGTAHHIEISQELGCLPTKNFQVGMFENADSISGYEMRKRICIKNVGCYGCSMLCGQWAEVKSGKYAGTALIAPEYETIGLLGSNCGVKNIEAIAKANYLCDDLGIDTISAGNVIAFAMECYERKIIDKNDTNGLDLRFGNEEAQLKLIEMISKKEGIGKILAEGVRRAAEVFGHHSEDFAMQVKGLEWSAYECKGAPGAILAFATSDRGADHQRAWSSEHFIVPKRFSIEGKPESVVELQHLRPAFDLLGVCRLYLYFFKNLEHHARMLSEAIGFHIDAKDLSKAAERVYNLTRAFNVREGFSRKDEKVPARCFEEETCGPAKGGLVTSQDFDRMLDRYYELRGWDKKTGAPTKAKLVELGLDDVAKELEKLGKI